MHTTAARLLMLAVISMPLTGEFASEPSPPTGTAPTGTTPKTDAAKPEPTKPGATPAPAGAIEAAGPAATGKLPDADPALAPLAFMAGRWQCLNPNKTVNREHWMSPAGKAMTAMFQQLRRDGLPAFYETTTIVAEPDGLVLYHRHLHIKFAIDERRKDADVFKLKSVEPGKVVWVPVKDVPGGIETMTYRADGPDKLVQELAFKPDSKEKNFATVYTREEGK